MKEKNRNQKKQQTASASPVKGLVEKQENSKSPRNLSHFSSSVRYSDVFHDVDLQCVLNGEDIKDNLVLKSKEADISNITDDSGSTTYIYDELDQMIRENNHILNKTITYRYDAGGNLTERKEYAKTEAVSILGASQKTDIYTYDSIWKDKLIAINGKKLTYDSIGNLLSYDGAAYHWSVGRQLSAVKNGKTIISIGIFIIFP